MPGMLNAVLAGMLGDIAIGIDHADLAHRGIGISRQQLFQGLAGRLALFH